MIMAKHQIDKREKDGIGNHPESQKTKEICDITPDSPEAEQVCKPLNVYRRRKSKQNPK
jgi:hypothetical protein